MKKMLCLCLCFMLLFSVGCAELLTAVTEETVALEDDKAFGAVTPLDVTSYTVYGPAPDENCFDGDSYSDGAITVEMSRVWLNDSCYNVARVRIADASQLRTALAGKLGKKTNYVWNIARNANAVVAIGGEDLAENTGTYTIRQTVVERKKGYTNRDTLYVDQNGDFHITRGFSKDTLSQLNGQGLQIINLFNFGPALVIDGQVNNFGDYKVGNVKAREPRTAMGQVGPLEYLLVVVDGRDVKAPDGNGGTRPSKGATMAEVAAFMAEQGCVQAYALDGGGSAVMYFHGKEYSMPSSKRGVSDIVFFATAPVGE